MKQEDIKYYEGGGIKQRCETNDRGEYDGKCIKYFSNGKIESINNYRQNILEGNSKYFHPNGTLSWEANYVDGLKLGCINYYDTLGNRFLNACFENNELNGESLTYFASGQLKIRSKFKDGNPIGIREIFDADGNLRETIKFNTNGDIIDYEKLDENSNVIDSFIRLNFSSKKSKSDFEVRIEIKESLGNELGVIIGDYSFDKKQLVDTFNIFSSKGKDFIEFKYSMQNHGNDEIQGIALDLQLLDDGKAILKRRRAFRYDLSSGKQIYKEITY